jgi:xylulokinase
MSHALGIDVGSTNAKVAIVAADGAVVATAARPIATNRAGDAIGQDPGELWDAVAGAIREATAAAPDEAADVATIGTCSQYSSTVGVAADGTPTSELVMYLDHRGTEHCWAIMDRHPDAFEVWLDRHGIPPVGSGLSLAHMLHLELDRPDTHAATAAYLEVMDFVNLRLTGRVAATQCSQFTAQLCDNRTLGVTSYDDELVGRAGIDASRLPPLMAPDEPVGTLAPDVATMLGLPPTAVVAAGMNDSHAGALATGAHLPGRAGVMIGTTSVLLDTTTEKRPTDLDHEVLSMPSPIDGHYLVWAENGMGGKALEHVLEHVVHAVDDLGDHGTADPFGRLEAVLGSTAAGAGGVIFLPWLAGSFSPKADPKVRGGFVNMSLDTRRPDLIRAVVEGICHNLGWLLPFVEAFADRSIDEVVFGGGAARSPAWAGILASVLDRPVHVLREPDHANARATALLALHRQGVLGLDELATRFPFVTTHQPDPAAVPVHRDMQGHFVASFDALRPVFGALNREEHR